MFKGTPVLDVHGHVSAPAAARNWIVGGLTSGYVGPSPLRGGDMGYGGGGPMGGRGPNPLSDEAFMTENQRHVDYMTERNIDVQVIGPRPFTMMGWMPRHLLPRWCEFSNDTIHKQCVNFPDKFLGASILPQIAEAPDLSNCVPEFEKNVKEYGFVAAYLSPDPAGRHDSPGMNTSYWDPIYAKCQEFDVPVFIHGTNCLDPRISHIPGNYQIGFVVETFLASRILAYGDQFKRFPNLRICIAHGGGALDRFVNSSNHRIPRGADIKNNLFFDTCVYDQDYLELTIKQWGVENICFGTEAPGSGGAVRKEGDHPSNAGLGTTSDNLLPVLDVLSSLSEADKIKIINTNPARVFPGFAKVKQPVAAK
ncbi:MAG TPA: amidohydrolase family protein [Chloroflexota bacterium]